MSPCKLEALGQFASYERVHVALHIQMALPIYSELLSNGMTSNRPTHIVHLSAEG
jgi:hypothetical protein